MEQYLTKVGTKPHHNLVTLHETVARKKTTYTQFLRVISNPLVKKDTVYLPTVNILA